MKTKGIAVVLAVVANGFTSGVTIAQTQVTHQNGLGQTWSDFTALGTYSANQATQAAQAWQPGAATAVNSGQCPGGGAKLIVFKQVGNACAAWAYSGTVTGRVKLTPSGGCYCPTTTDPTWN
jgi:hypothetical protein